MTTLQVKIPDIYYFPHMLLSKRSVNWLYISTSNCQRKPLPSIYIYMQRKITDGKEMIFLTASFGIRHAEEEEEEEKEV